MSDVHVRNLEQIQEDDANRAPRFWSWALVALGGAAIVFAGVTLAGRKSDGQDKKVDPLGDLVATRGRAQKAGSTVKATDLSTKDVTFPGLLSDGDNPTTALAAVRTAPVASASNAVAPIATEPPPPTDKLPVVALPAQNVLSATPVVTHPRDTLTRAATVSTENATPTTPAASAGHDGGYQLQVSSFRTEPEADAFADQLRARGHKAYVLEAKVPGRGTWYRVRVGPFSTQHAAAIYRSSFEAKEHVVPFIVPPSGK